MIAVWSAVVRISASDRLIGSATRRRVLVGASCRDIVRKNGGRFASWLAVISKALFAWVV